MTYHINAEKIDLDDLKKRFEDTDFVPSRASLMDDLDSNVILLKKHHIQNLANLRVEMKTPKRLESLSSKTGIDKNYLVLFRREIESYFPKPFSLKKFTWLSHNDIGKLEKIGIRNTADFYREFIFKKNKVVLDTSTQIKSNIIEELIHLCDLTRIQWASPTTTRMLYEAGYDSVKKIASVDDEKFYNDLVRVNEGDKYFKGKIGLRDIKRFINSAKYVLKWARS